MKNQPANPAKAIFERLVEVASREERAAILEAECGSNPELRTHVESLLRAYEQAGSFLEHPALGDVPTEVFAGTNTDPNADHGDPFLEKPEIPLGLLAPSEEEGSQGRLGQYEILESVGRGGMGIVLKGHDTKLNRIVAVKVLAPELASNATARTRFSKKAQAAAAVSHDHVVTIHAVEECGTQGENNLPYLVMEYIDGLSLQEKIDRDGPLELKEILRIGHQVAAGLSAAHLQGLIHRDVKPSNILLQNGVQRVKITDFGLARAVDDIGITRTGEVAGTPQYMSPEQAQAHAVDPRSDLFSLGSVLYAMCTGRSPFRADSAVAALRRVCDDTPRPIREINPEIPVWLVAIIDRLLEKKPADRIQTATEVADLLGLHLAHVQDPCSSPFPGSIQPVTKHDKSKKQGQRRWLIAGLVLIAMIGTLGVTEATGVTKLSATVIRIVTGEGTLVIEVDDPSVKVSLDGEELSISGAGLQEIKLRPGPHRFEAFDKNGKPVKQELVTITRGDREVVRVTREPTYQSDEHSRSTPSPGFVSLFDGSTLNGWQGETTAFSTENGILASHGKGNLFTTREYSDFILRFDFRLVRGANSGIAIRSPLVRDPAYEGFEIQILDDSSYDRLPRYLRHGSIWGVAAAKPGKVKLDHEWNHQEIRCLGPEVQVTLNGQVVLDVDLNTVKPADHKLHPGLTRNTGYIGLMGNTRLVEFRNIEIKELPPTKVEKSSVEPFPVDRASTVVENNAFVVLNGDGREVRKFNTLADAVKGATSGDIVEIGGNGPFEIEDLSITQPLTIRAKEGYLPTLITSLDQVNGKTESLVRHWQPLVLEGLRFQCVLKADEINSENVGSCIKSWAPLRIANCQFLMNKPYAAVTSRNDLAIVNSCIAVPPAVGIGHWGNEPFEISLNNCVLTTIDLGMFNGQQAIFKLTNNTFCTPAVCWRLWPRIDEPAPKSRNKIRVQASGNLYDTSHCFLGFMDPRPLKSSWEPSQAQDWFERQFAWQEQESLYSSSKPFAAIERDTSQKLLEVYPDLAVWKAACRLENSNLKSGTVRFEGGDIQSRLSEQPLQLVPQDFRLRPDSVGYQAGPDGKDLGADVDLVGPGAAYERWKRMPEYQEWLKITRQTVDGTAAESPDGGIVPDRRAAEWVLSVGGIVEVHPGKANGIAHLKDLPAGRFPLHYVMLGENPFLDDAGLAHLQNLEHLETLLLYKTRVTDRGLVHLSKLKSLKVLYLGYTNIGDVGMAHLSSLENLLLLSLIETNVSDEGLAYLQGSKKLIDLNLAKTQVSDEGLKALVRDHDASAGNP